MGMPCEVNSVLKLTPLQGYPHDLGQQRQFSPKYKATKDGYRIYPIGVPIPLVNQNWETRADVIIR